MNPYRVVFLGTSTFAVPILEALTTSEHELCGVYCQPDRPRGRSGKPQPCPVKEFCLQHGLPVYQPERLRGKEQRQQLAALNSDFLVVASYGQILTQKVLDLPRIAPLNVHASLLPRWRGASPIQQAILHGDPMTGVSIMAMVRELDAGPVLTTASLAIDAHDTATTLTEKLSHLGASLLMDTLANFSEKIPTPQPEEGLLYAGIIQRSDGFLSPTLPAQTLHRALRAYDPWPGVTFQLGDKAFKVLKAHLVSEGHSSATPGSLTPSREGGLLLHCGNDTALSLDLVQLEGKKAVSGRDFLNGWSQPLPSLTQKG
jgi:methionyl-tRNA formyltransferase